MKEFFFCELPHSTPQNPAEVVLSGQRTLVSCDSVYPFTYHATFTLDARSTALIGSTEITISDCELLHDSDADYEVEVPDITPDTDKGDTQQLLLDFDAAPTPRKPPPPEPTDLILEMSRGKALGKALLDFCKQHDAEHVTIDKHGIQKVYVNSYNEPEPIDDAFMPMPKGVMAKGKQQVTIIAEVLYRILQTTNPRNPSEKSFRSVRRSNYNSDKNPTRRQRKLMHGLGNEYVTITGNGKLEVKAARGKFHATLPTIQPTSTETETE